MFRTLKSKVCVIILLLYGNSMASPGDSLRRKDYERAANYLAQGLQKYVYNTSLRPNWLEGDKFWFLEITSKGKTFFLADPVKKTRKAAFDHTKLAQALGKATGKSYDPDQLPFKTIRFSPDLKTLYFSAEKKSWAYTPASGKLSESTVEVADEPGQEGFMARRPRTPDIPSPDGKMVAFLKDHNLWVRDVSTKKETQLTTDGVKDFGYATDNAGWTNGDGAIISWSPDSRKIATFQQDQRHVKDMYLVTTNVGSPTLKSWKYPLPGDKEVILIHRVVIDVPTRKVVRLKVDPDPRRSSLSDNITDSGRLADVDWSPDGKELAFLSTSRDHKISRMRIADTETGDVREVFEETVPTYYESGVNAINWRYFPATNEILWYSERDNWGHLYLYDSRTGKLKNQVTKGNFVVARVTDIDEKSRRIWFTTAGMDPKNPYYQRYCRVDFDGKNFTDLTPATGTHQITWSPSKKYLIDTYSEPDVPQAFELRDADGNSLLALGKADISQLESETGWTPATPVRLKAADGKTDIYGLVYTPRHFEPGKKYPVINYIYPGPQGGSVRSWGFSTVSGDNRALAELGFIVVAIEGTSNPYRSKSYHDMNYGNMGENTLPDQIAGIKQLAQQFPIDLDKVGIWGHSGGGFATAAAMFKYPDFYKVGISESGNHDNRNYEDDWGERYNGLLENADYEAQANPTYAKNLKGKLMLAHGMMDNNVPPYNTLLVVEALQKANKDFDLVIFPSATHGFGPYSNYMMRLRWDYFVRHLKGLTPPKEFDMGAYLSRMGR
ncbi:DPP IV N-terminal domain-containing protein [Leadbetterella sp. DM7]|uniref:S9 family peptidase n=1 Tax=Leadbetterella sp. DM7 TaxID=3235085 RepID=UPI00349E8F65